MEQSQQYKKKRGQNKKRHLQQKKDNQYEETKQNAEKKSKQNQNQDDFSSDDMEEEDINKPEYIDVNKRKQDYEEMEQEDANKNDGENNEQDQEPDYDMVNVDFVFQDPNDSQFQSIRVLLNGMLDGLSFNSGQLADIVVQQCQVGTMIAIDDNDEKAQQQKKIDSNVLAFTTILNWKCHLNNNVKVFNEIQMYLLNKSEQYNDKHKELVQLLNTKSIGLLLNERILNTPQQLIPTLHSQFIQDLQWLQNEDPKEAANFNFDYILVFSKCFKNPIPSQQDQQNKKKQKSKEVQLKEFIYQKFEDYLFMEKSEFYFIFEANSTKTGAGVTNLEKDQWEQVCYRIIYLLSFKEYSNVVPLLSQQLIQQ